MVKTDAEVEKLLDQIRRETQVDPEFREAIFHYRDRDLKELRLGWMKTGYDSALQTLRRFIHYARTQPEWTPNLESKFQDLLDSMAAHQERGIQEDLEQWDLRLSSLQHSTS